MHPARFVYHHTRISALGAAEAVPANNSGALVWHLRSGAKDAGGQYPKDEVYDALLFYSDVTFTYELAFWNTYLLAWAVFATGTITAGDPLEIPFPYEAGEIYFRRTSVTAGNANIYCQPKQASSAIAAAGIITIVTNLAAVTAAEDSPAVDGELGLKVWRVRRDVPINSAGSDGDYCTPNTDADGYDYTRDKAYDSASNSDRGFEVAPVWSRNVQTPVSLIAAAQNVTATWVGGELGPEVPTQGYTKMGLWLNIDMNDSQNVRVRILNKHTSAGADEYQSVINSVDTTGVPFNVKFQGEYLEYDVDADGLVVLPFDVANFVPFVQFQVMAEVVGATAAQILSAYVTYGYGG